MSGSVPNLKKENETSFSLGYGNFKIDFPYHPEYCSEITMLSVSSNNCAIGQFEKQSNSTWKWFGRTVFVPPFNIGDLNVDVLESYALLF